MSSDSRSSGAASSSSSSSPATSLDLPPSPNVPLHTDSFPDPPGIELHSLQLPGSPPLDQRPYSPHSLGIGILSPQPILGPRSSLSSRTSLPPVQTRLSPILQRSSTLDSPRTAGNAIFFDATVNSPSSSSIEEPLTAKPSPLVVPYSSALAGLRLDLPPTNPITSSSTPSPPLFPPPTAETISNTISATFDISIPRLADISGYSSIQYTPGDLAASSADELDLAEIDTEGLSALEKIYLFSRSRASFHRVYITHALSSYLSSSEPGVASSSSSHHDDDSSEDPDSISPADAVEYVLPLLTALAMDEEESVKEALAVELLPIIWWYITHCKLVEDDTQVGPPLSPRSSNPTDAETLQNAERPTDISVQAFTPILGTLLLSPNVLVGGPARYAVVELLKRVHRADQSEEGATIAYPLGQPAAGPSSGRQEGGEEDLNVGLLGWTERRLLENEIVHQVVIGMGKLDIVDVMEEDQQPYLSQRPGSKSGPTDSGQQEEQEVDSYFPVLTSAYVSPTAKSEMVVDSTLSPLDTSIATPTFAFSISSPSPSPHGIHPDSAIPEPVASLSSPPPSSSTPSLVLSDSTSSVSSSSTTTLVTPQSSGALIPSGASSPLQQGELNNQDPCTPQTSTPDDASSLTLTDTDVEMMPADDRARAHPRFAHDVLTSLQSQQPVTFQQLSPGAQWSPGPAPQSQNQFEALPHSPSGQVPPLVISDQDWAAGDGAGAGAGVGPDGDDDGMDVETEGDLSAEAALGRLSSMSLMAAVTASGSIGDDTKRAFVTEVERVAQDTVYWVRREASFAVGALAKVVPVELVTTSLLPLFESLCQDPTWHVRQSVLFALPAILSRLLPSERRRLSLQTMLPLAWDESSTVRYAVLEALGEVMYTFKDDEDGPPSELLNLFVGERSDALNAFARNPSTSQDAVLAPAAETDIYNEPARPLVCAFNIPAVALTLGRDRWLDLRELYKKLAGDQSMKVRRTLAASLGELAKIIGPEHARDDLIDVWWASMRADESEVRLKAVECVEVLVAALAEEDRTTVVRGLEEEFVGGRMRGWRERVEVARALGPLVEIEGAEENAMRRLLMAALEDRVAAIREAAIASLPQYMAVWKSHPDLLDQLTTDIMALAQSDSFRKRTVFVACEQAIILSDEGDIVLGDEAFWDALTALSEDSIVDVRIRIARLLSIIYDKYASLNKDVATKTLLLAGRLAQDSSHEAQAFVVPIFASGPRARPKLEGQSRTSQNASTFSRPPPPAQG